MKILVTGAAGYLGSVLVGILLEQGHEVSGYDICMFGAESLLGYMNDSRFTFIQGDIRDTKKITEALSGIDCVCHVAALVGEPACRDESLAKSINTQATIKLLNLSKKYHVKHFIFTSTCSNYGIVPRGKSATETSPLQPLSVYAQTKIAAENALLASDKNTCTVTIFRLSTLFGLSPRMRFNLLINEFVRNAWGKKPMMVYKPNAYRPYVHVQDAAKCIALAINKSKIHQQTNIYNIGLGNYSKKDIITSMKQVIPQCKVQVVDKHSDNRDYQVSFHKFQKKFGYTPKISILDGIKQIYAALEKGVFIDPFNNTYSSWLNETILKLSP